MTQLDGQPPVFGTWNHFRSTHRERTDRPLNKAYLSDQWCIVKECKTNQNIRACNIDASDFTCWYVCEMLRLSGGLK